jgi:hypothetical protein
MHQHRPDANSPQQHQICDHTSLCGDMQDRERQGGGEARGVLRVCLSHMHQHSRMPTVHRSTRSVITPACRNEEDRRRNKSKATGICLSIVNATLVVSGRTDGGRRGSPACWTRTPLFLYIRQWVYHKRSHSFILENDRVYVQQPPPLAPSLRCSAREAHKMQNTAQQRQPVPATIPLPKGSLQRSCVSAL